MSITLTQDRYIDGVLTTAGSVVTTLDAATEANFVQLGMATWTVEAPYQGGEVTKATAVLNASGGIDYFLGNDGTKYAALPLGALATSGPAIIIPRRAEQYDVVNDGVALYDASTTNSTTSTVNSPSGSFKSTDVGKCCAVHSRSGTVALANARYGFITAVASPTQCTAVFNLSPGALTNAMFVYGTDNAVPMQAAITAAIASRDKILKLPGGIICSSAGLTGSGNIIMEGAGRSYTELEWYNFDYAGTTLAVCGSSANAALYFNGSTTGPRLYGFNVDAMGISQHGLRTDGRAASISDVTVLKPLGGSGNSHALKMGPGSMVDHCTIIGGYNCHPLAAGGDSQVTSCNIYGAGTGYFACKLSGVSDFIFSKNHVWALGAGTFNSGSVFIEAWQSSAPMGSVKVSNNQFDTAQNAPHISISVAANCKLLSVDISNNNAFNNNAVTTPYPWLSLSVAAGGEIRGLGVKGNEIMGSWSDPTQGLHSYLIDGTGIVGAVKGSRVALNNIDRPTVGGYNTFTPDYTAGNTRVNAAGTVTVF